MTLALALLCLAATPAQPLAKAGSVAQVLAGLNRQVRLHGPVISGDGRRVAWVEQVATPDGPASDRSLIQVADRTQPERPPQHVTAQGGGPFDESDLAFSPDGTRLAFLSDAASKGQPELYVADLATSKVTALTHVTGHLEQPRFSPDGKRLAVLCIEGAADALGPLGPATRQTGVVEEEVKEQRLGVMPADGSAPMQLVSPPPLFIYEYDWRPDGQGFATIAAPGSGDDNYWVAQLHVLDLGTGKDQAIYKPALQLCEPHYAPDGKNIAFIEGLMSDAGANGGDVFVIPAAGGAARNLTRALRGSASSLQWLKPEAITFGMQVEGDSAFAQVPVVGGKVSILWRDAGNVTRDWVVGAAFARDGETVAAISEAFDRAPEVVAGKLGAWQRLTHSNQGLNSPAGPAQSVTWRSDRFEVQGWLLSPPQLPASGKAPMVVLVHGGPAGAVRSHWDDTSLLLASQGYFVFLPNPRGSFGQGEAFTRANVKDFGHGDLRDILAGVDAVLRLAPVDPERIGIYGHSYGGYMAMWAVTQTRRFSAAVASAGIANWQSYYGQNRIDQWMLPYFGKTVYADPATYAKSSPITFINQVKTPTLVLHGERDAECPLPQGQEFWHALKTLHVETQLVVYPDEGHHFRNPAHVRDHAERMVGWFDRFLKR
jgi:dipeptidyl aminopeptidase/acylaminoacyl peptidase